MLSSVAGSSSGHSELCSESRIRTAAFIGLEIIGLIMFRHSILQVVGLALRSDPYSHILLIPELSAALLYMRRKVIFAKLEYGIAPASFLFVLAAMTYVLSRDFLWHFETADSLALAILALFFLTIGAFVLCYGSRAARNAAFPLLFLVLVVPIPGFALDRIIEALQHWSADLTEQILNLFTVPVNRDGLIFRLPGLSIFVAEECSGIHSSIALFITLLLAAELFLKSKWNKLVICLFVVPIAVLKNAIRIATLSVLAVYVDRSFLTGRLHREGGVVFFLLGLLILTGFLGLLRRYERRLAAT